MSDSPEFTRISLAAVRALARENHADFQLFLPSPDGDQPVLYRRGDAGLADPDFQRMTEQGVNSLLVQIDDFTRCERAIEAKLADILNNPHVHPGDKAQIAHTTGASIARGIIKDSVTPAAIERTAHIVDNMIGCVLNDPVVAAYLLQMAGHERSTASHMFIVSTLAVMLGATVFGPDQEELRSLAFAGMLHDVGKLSVARELLNKSSPLTREEMLLVQQHPIESVRLIGDDPNISACARQMILQHHERVDGRGYPIGVSGDDLLPGSRVLSIVDSFHAMIGPRSYRAALSPSDANRVLTTQAGRQFDEKLLVCWQEVFRRYWSESAVGAGMRIPEVADELSPRHEHRPVAPPPKTTNSRPKRHTCNGSTMVQCKYAGRLPDVSTAPPEFGALVHDISRSGLSIYSAHPMYRGEVLHVQLNFDGEPVWISSTVAWCRKQDANAFRIGLRFTRRVDPSMLNHPATVLPLEHFAHEVKKAEEEAAQEAGPAVLPAVEPVRDKRQVALQTLAAISCMRRPSSDAQKSVVTLAMSGDVQVRLKAVEVLAGLGTNMARRALISLLDDSNPEVREQVVAAVGADRLDDAIPKLGHLLRDPCETVALRAAGALGRMGDTSGLRLVKTNLKYDGPFTRLAAQMFGEITGHRFAPTREGIRDARRYLKAKQAVYGT